MIQAEETKKKPWSHDSVCVWVRGQGFWGEKENRGERRECVVINYEHWNLFFKISFVLQNTDAGLKICVHSRGESGMNWESSIDLYTLPCIKQLVGSCYTAQGAQLSTLWWPGGVGCGDAREAQEGGDICILIADSRCSIAETNATF